MARQQRQLDLALCIVRKLRGLASLSLGTWWTRGRLAKKQKPETRIYHARLGGRGGISPMSNQPLGQFTTVRSDPATDTVHVPCAWLQRCLLGPLVIFLVLEWGHTHPVSNTNSGDQTPLARSIPINCLSQDWVHTSRIHQHSRRLYKGRDVGELPRTAPCSTLSGKQQQSTSRIIIGSRLSGSNFML